MRVSDGPETSLSILPFIETGSTPGSVGVVWIGTSEPINVDSANWQVFYAHSSDANAATPTFRQVVASDHFIHASNVSEGGTFGNKNRNLLDYFQVSFDPTGAAVIAYTDDHNDFDGYTYMTRQTSGPALNGGTVPAPVEGSTLPGPPAALYDGSQVRDFPRDAATGSTSVVPTDDPFDIVSIKYSCEACSSADPFIVATMKVSALPAAPPSANWRMNFAANVPFAVVSPLKDYTFGLSDRGDQFFVRATTNASGTPTYTFGTTVRNSNGSLTYTDRGAADSGSIDTNCQIITIKVSASKLNPFIPVGHTAIGAGSVLAGLRGQTFTSGSSNGKRDLTRGGTQYTITPPLPRGTELFDFTGDIKTDLTVFRPTDSYWYTRNSADGSLRAVVWGNSGDVLVPGDYDGDGKTDEAVWRPSTGYWYILKSSDGLYIAEQWGGASLNDKPVPGDYDGDGRTDIAVWRPGDGVWYIHEISGGILIHQWGHNGDIPAPSTYPPE
ncbi:MAG TPA: VCBS repeat-containing protein [Pyrinomonadaceae bacterium]